MSRLEDLKAIVTGAADGIGAAIAEQFAAEGAKVLAVDIQDSPLQALANDSQSIHALVSDVTSDRAPQAIVQKANEALGGIDVLVNNAGIAPVFSLEETTDQVWQRVMDVNLNAAFRLSRAAIVHLRRSKAGRIINLGSIMSDYSAEGMGAYAASKHAVAGLTRTLATELGKDGITANFLQPGAIVTGITKAAFEADEGFRNFWINKSASGRLGLPIDVARVAVFLASSDAAFVNGQGILVDGGAMQSP